MLSEDIFPLAMVRVGVKEVEPEVDCVPPEDESVDSVKPVSDAVVKPLELNVLLTVIVAPLIVDPEVIDPFIVSIPAGVNEKLPAPSLMPSTGSIVIFSTPD